MSSVRSAMCWQPGERYQSRYSWIWLFFLPGRRLVDRELDPAVAVGHDLRHQRAVVGVDDLVVVVDELGEAQDVAVEVDERVHLAEPDVADAVIDLEQAEPAGRPRGGRGDLAVARARTRRGSRAGRRTSGASRRRSGSRSGAGPRPRRRRSRTAPARRPPRAVVVSRQADSTSATRERDVMDAVAMRPDVLGDLAVRGQRRREHEADAVLDHDVARPVADLRLEAAEGDRGEAPQGAVVGAAWRALPTQNSTWSMPSSGRKSAALA